MEYDNAEGSTASRKRPRVDETPQQALKREKAAERQRRKRERDRNGGVPVEQSAEDAQQAAQAHAIIQAQQQQMALQEASMQHVAQMAKQREATEQFMLLQQAQQQQQLQQIQQISQPTRRSKTHADEDDNLTPEEIARRDKVRTAARDRQRKHRELKKKKKEIELGHQMGNQVIPGPDEPQYRVDAHGNYQQIHDHDLQAQQAAQEQQAHDLNFLQNQQPMPPSGQTFASTLLLSFSASPILKQHLMRTLHMTNEELASLEPIIADAFDRWDHARRAQFMTEAKPDPTTFPGGPADHEPSPNEFRARFHRSIVAPSPFQPFDANNTTSRPFSQNNGSNASGASTPESGTEAIDPALSKQEPKA